MPDLGAFFLPPARHFYDDVATADDRREIDATIRAVCADPYADGEKKEWSPFPPATPMLHHDDRFYIVYDHQNNWTRVHPCRQTADD